MSDEKNIYKLADDVIALIRELVQLSLLTGTNIIDHFRALELEELEGDGKLYPTERYVNEYNKMIEGLTEAIEAAQAEAQNTVATDKDVN